MRVGIVGWRGMVGSVLLDRMRAEDDFAEIEPTFFTTSDVGGPGPDVGRGRAALVDAYDLDALAALDVVVTCQGTDYSKSVHPRLRQKGWGGYWIDAARALRMHEDTVLLLDPVNRDVIEAGLARGVKTFAGANCTVSLMLMALAGLFRAGLVEWLSSMTYQAASGAGAVQMRELVRQMAALGRAAGDALDDPASAILELDRRVLDAMRSDAFPTDAASAPLAGSLLPWIDSAVGEGRTREEWKAGAEGNKILGREADPIPLDGLCVRVGSMRSHAQAFTIKLARPVPLDEVEERIASAHEWVEVVPNDRDSTLERLTPTAASGTLRVPVGRIRRLAMGDDYLTAFSVGDQLLWGAAEPLRRMLRLLCER